MKMNRKVKTFFVLLKNDLKSDKFNAGPGNWGSGGTRFAHG
jgi:hypothetical protein